MVQSASVVSIRPFCEETADALFDAMQDPRCHTHTFDPIPTDRERSREDARAQSDFSVRSDGGYWLNWTVHWQDDVVGYVQATVYGPPRDGHVDADIAYVLNPRAWGRSVGYAAAQLLLHALEHEFGVTRVWVTIRYTNPQSIALAQRLSLQFVHAARYPYDNYEPTDLVLMRELKPAAGTA
jgi:RimJ/RimL family protein N-acetyltransferase